MSNDKIVQIKNLSLIFGINTINELNAIDDFTSYFAQSLGHNSLGIRGPKGTQISIFLGFRTIT